MYTGRNAEYVAVASDPVHGPLIVVETLKGKVLAKEGKLSAPWVTEYSGALHIAAASDAKHGPLIGIVTSGAKVLVKEGSLTAKWHDEYNGAQTIALASDTKHGPLIATGRGQDKRAAGEAGLAVGQLAARARRRVRCVGRLGSRPRRADLGRALGAGARAGQPAGQGGRAGATWHLERTLVGDASVASDPVYGPMIGLETYTPKDYVKLGKLSAKWVHEWNASFLVQVAD